MMNTIIASGAANTDPACLHQANTPSRTAATTSRMTGRHSANSQPAANDVLAAALLLAPAANGGPVRTIGLLPGSPALGAGGQCTDPTAGETPLLTDARGHSAAGR